MARPTRRFRRVTARVRVEFFDEIGLRRETATTLGAGGLFVATEVPVDRGARLKLRFRVLPGGLFHDLEARVVWTQGPDDPGDYTPGMGVEFTDPAAASRLAGELEQL